VAQEKSTRDFVLVEPNEQVFFFLKQQKKYFHKYDDFLQGT